MLAGSVRVEPVNGGSWPVSGGILHHWRAAALVPEASSQDMLALLRDYDHLARYYAPEVVFSRALTDGGERATLAMRIQKQLAITVVLDAEFEIQLGPASGGRGYSLSRSKHIWQVDEPGLAQERRRTAHAPGTTLGAGHTRGDAAAAMGPRHVREFRSRLE